MRPLVKYLEDLLEEQGELLLAINALRQADHFYHSLKLGRLMRSKKEAQGLIGKFAAFKASGVAINPLLMLDLATGLAFDAALVMELSKLYGLQMRGNTARELLKRLSNTFGINSFFQSSCFKSGLVEPPRSLRLHIGHAALHRLDISTWNSLTESNV